MQLKHEFCQPLVFVRAIKYGTDSGNCASPWSGACRHCRRNLSCPLLETSGLGLQLSCLSTSAWFPGKSSCGDSKENSLDKWGLVQKRIRPRSGGLISPPKSRSMPLAYIGSQYSAMRTASFLAAWKSKNPDAAFLALRVFMIETKFGNVYSGHNRT